MKFLRLEILNLASLDNPDGEVIDFTGGPLGRSDIFCIVGATGSGKSTILDAICLALYNMTPRFTRRANERKSDFTKIGKEKDSSPISVRDTRNILTRGKSEGYSKLTFVTNDGKTYRAEWHVKKKRVNYENAVTELKLLTTRDGKTVEKDCDWNMIPTLIGLDFDQFLNTVVLAQGAFSRFLKSDEKERVSLLEKLMGSDGRYDRIVENVKKEKDDVQHTLDKLKASCEAYTKNLLDAETLSEHKSTLAQLEERQRELKAQRSQLEKELRWYADEALKKEELEKSSRRLDAAQKAMAAFKPKQMELRLHDEAAGAFGLVTELLRTRDSISKLEGSIRELDDEISSYTKLVGDGEAKLKELNLVLQQAEKEYDDNAPRIRDGRILKSEIDAIVKVIESEHAREQEGRDNVTACEKGVSDNRDKLAELIKDKELKEAELEAFNNEKVKEQDVFKESLDALTLKIESLKDLIKDVDIKQLEIQKADAEVWIDDIARLSESISRLKEINATLADYSKQESALNEENTKLAECKAVKDKEIAALQKEIEVLNNVYTLTTSEKWEQHRLGLHEGTPCPLCGAESHPYALNQELYESAVSEMEKLLADKRASLGTRNEEVRELEKSISDVARKLGKVEGVIAKSKSEQTEFEQKKCEILLRREVLQQDLDNLSKPAGEWEGVKVALAEQIKQYNGNLAELQKISNEKIAEQEKYEKFNSDLSAQLSQREKECGRIRTDIQSAENQQPLLAANLVSAQNALAAVMESIAGKEKVRTEKADKLAELLGDKDPDEFEEALKTARNEADNGVKKQQKDLEASRTTLSSNTGLKSGKMTQLSQEKENNQNADRELAQWLAAYNSNEDKVRELDEAAVQEIQNSKQDWKELRNQKDELANELAAASTLCDKGRVGLEEHSKTKPSDSLETINEKIALIDADKSHESAVTLKAALDNHETAEKELGSNALALERTETLLKDWELIQGAVGSDGKMLRLLSQCYALGFLVEHANAEIRRFNTRYELVQVSNSLEIRVIDHDLADDVRAINSLSGGETFIVSLGLALGLSSMSSRNISFENLFIDEGFGTLDQETLAIVIDSLAALQTSQGKKVGVISHTDAMSERIPTQIRVIKKGGTGSSRIQVV